MNRFQRNVVNFVLFQIGWFACAFGAGAGAGHISLAVIAAILTVHHFRVSQNRARDVLFIFSAGLLGGVLDSVLGYAGVFTFNGNWHPPPWLFGLWMLFASTVYYSLSWLQHRYVLLAPLGAAGGGLSYYAGHRFGALELADPVWQSALIVAGVWSLAAPAIFRLAAWIERRCRLGAA